MALTVTQTADIESRLARYVAGVLALPHAEQLADLSVFEMAVEFGRALERERLHLPRRVPQQSRHLTLVGP